MLTCNQTNYDRDGSLLEEGRLTGYQIPALMF